MRPLVVHLCIIGILMKHLVDMGYFFQTSGRNGAFQRIKAPFAKGRFQFTDCPYC